MIKRIINPFFLLLVSFFIMQSPSAQTIDRIVAIVNNEIITQSDVDRVLATMEAEFNTQSNEENIINQMVEEKLILCEARAYDITVDESKIEARIEQIRKDFPSEQGFEQALEVQGLTLQDLQDRFRDQQIMKTAVDYFVASKVDIQPSELEAFFKAHQQDFFQPERAKIESIHVKGSDYQAMQKAKIAIRRLKEGESLEDWEDLGFIEKGQLIDEIDQAIFDLEPGEFTDALKTESGYRIFKLIEKKPKRPLTFSEAQDIVRDVLYKKKFSEIFREWLEGLKQNAYIVLKHHAPK